MAKARKSRKKGSGPAVSARRKAGRVRHPARDAQLAFEAIAIEGGLLSPDWLARATQLQAGAQSEADYHIPKGLQLRDEIGRYWRIAQALWTEFSGGREASTTSEEQTQALAERFVLALLRESFGFGTLGLVDPVEVEGRSYAIGFSALDGRVPLVIAPGGNGLDTLSPAFGDGSRRRSAFGLCQEFLNAEDGALWGLVSDGVTLRIARDNASLTRPAWIEADLGRIFTEERYADFAALWLLVHETRFGRLEQPVTECSLETWREAGREEGTRAREHLRHGVEEALVALGQGFLCHPENRALRTALADGSLTKEAYFQELLRLVYRLIFLLTVEERGVLHPNQAAESARKLYADGYSLRRLRERSVKRSAHDRFHDNWETMKIVFGGLATGEPRLGLPALAGIFATEQCPSLDTARLENRFLLLSLFRLSWLREQSGLSRVNWRDMGPEELGSVYESLLELVPQITEGGHEFGFAIGAETKGHARKTTGSYYTPDSLVQALLDSALQPVIDSTIAEHPSDPVEALLSLSIVDPASGSGHFLLAAARRLAAHVARLQAGGTPSAAEYRRALREVVGRCIYGVDLNPMAVELCKVSLWMEALDPGLPLTFLDSHIRHGNALLGTTPGLTEKGIPDDAWKPIEGDDRKVAGALKKRNKDAAQGQRGLGTLWSKPARSEIDELREAVTALEYARDADVDALARKESQWQKLLDSEAYQHQTLVADAWCAAFVWPKQLGPLVEVAPTNELWRQIRDGQGHVPDLTVRTVKELAELYTFFHWHLAFPQVFARGGFDVVLGNPPWERVKLQEKEFFASRSGTIAAAQNAAARKKLIAKLPELDPQLWSEWRTASRKAGGESHVMRQSGRYPLCGKGDINTFAIFAEHMQAILAPQGRLGCIVPAGIATDDTTKDFFQRIVQGRTLCSLYHFENEERVFVGVNNMFRFVLLTVAGPEVRTDAADIVVFARRGEHIQDVSRHYSLTSDEISILNPNTGTFPPFPGRRDADINLALYDRSGVLWREADTTNGNPWQLRFMAMLHMANDSKLFKTREQLEGEGMSLAGSQFVGEYLPLVEAKMVHHFDHRFATYEGATQANLNKGTLPQSTLAQHQSPIHSSTPQYWVPQLEVASRLADRWHRKWLLGWRKITNAHNERTLIAALLPHAGVGDSFYVLTSSLASEALACLYANLCSFVLDYAARQKVGGTNFVYHTFKQLPVLSPAIYGEDAAWHQGLMVGGWLQPRVLELTYTAWDLESFARDVGYRGPPFRWDSERRFLLRAELDAAFFHLCGIERDDVDYIMETFPIVRKNDEKAHGEYRTKRVILEIYDAMSDAAQTGEDYQTSLDPPPADPRLAHPPRPQKSVAEAAR